MSGRFVPHAPGDVIELIGAYPLAWIVSNGDDGFAATPLPLLAETDGDGSIRSLLGHFARRNPHVALLERSPRATILFQGPQGYISPRLVSNPSWAPTWNYAVAKFDVEIGFAPEENDAAIVALAAKLEAGAADPWTVERMGERYERMLPGVIAFHARVIAIDARFKLGQDERPETFDEIVGRLDDAELARWMVRATRG